MAFDNERDIHHEKTLPLWIKIANGEYGVYFTSDYIFDEVISVSLRKWNKEKAEKIGNQAIRSLPMIKVNWDLFDDAWKIFKESKTNLSFTDCTNLAIMQIMNINKIATFDKAFNDIQDLEVIC